MQSRIYNVTNGLSVESSMSTYGGGSTSGLTLTGVCELEANKTYRVERRHSANSFGNSAGNFGETEHYLRVELWKQ